MTIYVCVKVLVVSDDAEIRRVVKTGKCVLNRLAPLTAVKQMKDLVPAFKVKILVNK